LLKKISRWNFCSVYYKSYCLEIDSDTLTDKESKAFDALDEVATRFSDYEEDLRNYPGVYYTKQELDQKIIETKEALKDCWISTDQ
jgi:hypothetical protein